jgi:hypothetical protein
LCEAGVIADWEYAGTATGEPDMDDPADLARLKRPRGTTARPADPPALARRAGSSLRAASGREQSGQGAREAPLTAVRLPGLFRLLPYPLHGGAYSSPRSWPSLSAAVSFHGRVRRQYLPRPFSTSNGRLAERQPC